LDKTSPVWELGTVTNIGQLKTASYGNGKEIAYGYDEYNRLNSISVPNVIDFTYQFNNKQQLDYREEKSFNGAGMQGFTENFTYDGVNRLLTASIGSTQNLAMEYADGANDGITIKSDAGAYQYVSGKHQISTLTTVAGYTPTHHVLTYTDEGKVATIKEMETVNDVDVENKSVAFEYGVDDQRFKMEYKEAGATKYTRYYSGEYEKEVKADGTVRHLNYINAPGGLVAIYEQTTSSSKIHYIYTDYLGSLRCITDASGTVEQNLSFDAWGNRRNPLTGVNYTTTPTDLMFARGYTGHEHIDELGLINMNGRVYDPALGMFLSPDNYVQQPDNTQNFNRYTYCVNNPLMYSDATGEVFGIDDAIMIAIIAYSAYEGGVATNHGQPNPAKWNWNSASTYTGVIGGGIVGWATFGIGSAMFNAGVPMTINIIYTSTYSSITMNAVTEDNTPISTSFGVASYNWSTGDWGHLGKKGNSVMENIGYGIGAFANVSDAWALYKGVYKSGANLGSKELLTENDNPFVNHSAVGNVGSTQEDLDINLGPSKLLSNGIPDITSKITNEEFDFKSFDNSLTTRIEVNNLLIDKYNPAVDQINEMTGKVTYNLFFNNCTTGPSIAFLKAGVFNIPIWFPRSLEIQMFARSYAQYSWLLTH
jgi:RHS repeat-associated protein